MQEPLYDEDGNKQLQYKNSEVIIGNVIDQLSLQRQKFFTSIIITDFSTPGLLNI